ncbi:MAG: hypothetical protein WB755_21480 [Terriglobales bacterium]|jgi:hypothetical protein
MDLLPFRWRRLILATACLTCARFVTASDEPTLTKEQIKQFLLTAKVVDSSWGREMGHEVLEQCTEAKAVCSAL